MRGCKEILSEMKDFFDELGYIYNVEISFDFVKIYFDTERKNIELSAKKIKEFEDKYNLKLVGVTTKEDGYTLILIFEDRIF